MATTKDNGKITEISRIRPGHKVRVRATVTALNSRRIKNGNLMTNGVISDSSGSVKCVWFSKAPLYALKAGNEYVFEGPLELKYGHLALQKPSFTFVSAGQQTYVPKPAPKSVTPHPVFGQSTRNTDNIASFIIFGFIVFGIGLWVYNSYQNRQVRSQSGVSCKDVTSIDYNWNNDILCTNPDGSTFYTNYSGANKYGYSFP